MDEVLTTTEVGKLLKCNKDFVVKLILAGLLPYMFLGSRKIRRKAVEEFLLNTKDGICLICSTRRN